MERLCVSVEVWAYMAIWVEAQKLLPVLRLPPALFLLLLSDLSFMNTDLHNSKLNIVSAICIPDVEL